MSLLWLDFSLSEWPMQDTVMGHVRINYHRLSLSMLRAFKSYWLSDVHSILCHYCCMHYLVFFLLHWPMASVDPHIITHYSPFYPVSTSSEAQTLVRDAWWGTQACTGCLMRNIGLQHPPSEACRLMLAKHLGVYFLWPGSHMFHMYLWGRMVCYSLTCPHLCWGYSSHSVCPEIALLSLTISILAYGLYGSSH